MSDEEIEMARAPPLEILHSQHTSPYIKHTNYYQQDNFEDHDKSKEKLIAKHFKSRASES